MPNPTAVDPSAPLLVTDREAAQLCGIGRSTWHRLRAAGRVPPPVKLGGACRWRRDELERWITAGCPAARVWAAIQAARPRLAR